MLRDTRIIRWCITLYIRVTELQYSCWLLHFLVAVTEQNSFNVTFFVLLVFCDLIIIEQNVPKKISRIGVRIIKTREHVSIR